ncbi:hypothetical protein MMC24_007174 [Lignoscripta atroalba]|nr:hypothetical protein [Lignoscripta atroalba]
MVSRGGASTAYPRQITPRNIPLTITLVAFIVFIVILSTSSVASVPSVSELSSSAKDAAKHIHRPSIPHPKLPNIHNPFRAAAHEPPVQRNSTSGEAKWYSDWKWLNPFSSAITLDENRSVLPPLHIRPPIYTFYDAETEKDEETSAAENKLLLIWRRAWWAQGFRPVILGKAEAMKNPIYESLQVKKLDPSLEAEIMRWLAWGHMGTGILANWLVLPMGPRDDHLISYLRRGQYPRLTRYENLGNGLFSGDQTSIEAAISVTLSSGNLETAKTFLEAIADPDIFSVDPKPAGIAFYDSSTITSSYKAVADAILTKQSSGLRSLAELITSHLHTTFLNTYTSGLAILSPHASYSTVLVSPALALAHALTTCSTTPIPDSCPPNAPKCTPCSSTSSSPIIYPTTYSNTSSLYTIGTIPHPFTLASFLARKSEITTKYIRRETARDPWLLAITAEMQGKDIAGPARIVGFKEAVASEWGSAHGIWSTAERDYEYRDLEWHFGFSLPVQKDNKPDGGTAEPETFASLRPLLSTLTSQPSATDLTRQNTLLETAKEVIQKSEKGGAKAGIKEVVEAWNLADTEAWRFVRAFEARSRVERLKWEEEERKYVGGSEGEGRGQGWGRWFDRT